MSGNLSRDPASTRDAVIDRYSGLARIVLAGGAIADDDTDSAADSCFGAAAYPESVGAPETALQASLGCGNPVAVASLNPAETVLDLGSGGGLDVLLSAQRVGPAGTVYGLDASPDMLALARANADAAGVANAVFLQGDIEDIPLPDEHVDVVISNCVICLSADKPKVVAETFRVLRPGGRLGISDVIADSANSSAPEEWVGCVSLTEPQYRDLLLTVGFTAISITSTHAAAPGLQSAIIQAAKPSAEAHDEAVSRGLVVTPLRSHSTSDDYATTLGTRELKPDCQPGSRPIGYWEAACRRDRAPHRVDGRL